ncbi:MAG: 30S ribosomal protein S12 methylthiotransferase RimO [Polyangiales bacterium]
MAKTIHFVSLGCPKNQVDTEIMLGVSAGSGYDHVDDPRAAEVIVVNTCGFIDAAKQESLHTVLELAAMKEEGRCERLVMAGCLAQRYVDELSDSLPEVDHFLGSSDMLQLRQVLDHQAERILVGNPADYSMRASDPRRLSQRRHSAYLKIAEGCNRHCSFCAIPSFRGKQRSRPLADIVLEAEQLIDQGVVELNLISQDTIAYGRDLPGKCALSDVVEALAALPGLGWLRLHYLYPERIDARLMTLMAEHPKVLPYIDMPLQHASDAMLRRMRRGHGGARLYRLIDQLRRRISDVSLRSAFIIGHPGESEEDFRALYDFIAWAQFDHLGLFRYSPEEGTASAGQEGAVSAAAAYRRQRKLMALQRKVSRKRLKARRGAVLEVLVDGVSDESDWLTEGRHGGQAIDVDGKVILTDAQPAPGTFCQVRITDSGDYDLVGQVLSAAPAASPQAPTGTRSSSGKRRLPVSTLL